jgi:hypothetical protein
MGVVVAASEACVPREGASVRCVCAGGRGVLWGAHVHASGR